MKRIYIFPRYSADENSDWYQYAKEEMSARDNDVQVIPLTFPNWDKPEIAEFLSFIENKIPINEIDSNTFFVAHSIGCKAALLYLNELQMKNPLLKIGGLMCVAGWWRIDKPWKQLKQWINLSADYSKIQENCSHNIISILSDNDPYTTDTQANKELWEINLNAKVVIIPNAKHFNNEGFDEIINELTLFIR